MRILSVLPVLLFCLAGCGEDEFGPYTHGTFTDSRDQNEYNWIRIGEQIWMAGNLAWLPAVSNPSKGSDTETYYYVTGYQGDDADEARDHAHYATYGVLYNWQASRKACPEGWRLPTDSDWTELTDWLAQNGYGHGGSGNDIGKSIASTTGWQVSAASGTLGNNPATNNKTGFNAPPGGYRRGSGGFYGRGVQAAFWMSSTDSTSHARALFLTYDDPGVVSNSFYRRDGFSVRCVKK
jgi:uncharacterized protein (TIGR02145 family)